MGEPIRSRRDVGHAATRELILKSARELFAARGYHAATIRAIAERASVSNTLLYYYYSTKQELLEALLVSHEMSASPPVGEWSFREAWLLSDQLLEIVYSWVEKGELMRLLVVECFSGNSTVAEFFQRTNDEYIAGIRPALSSLPGGETDIVAQSLMYTLLGALWDAIIRHGRRFEEVLTRESERERLRSLILLILPPTQPSTEAA